MTELKAITPSPGELKVEIKDTPYPNFLDKYIWTHGHLLSVYNVYVTFTVNFTLTRDQLEELQTESKENSQSYIGRKGWSSEFTGDHLSIIVPFPELGKRVKVENTAGSNKWRIMGAPDGATANVAIRKVIRTVAQSLGIKNPQLEKVAHVEGINAQYEPQTRNLHILLNKLNKTEGFFFDPEQGGAPSAKKDFYDAKDVSKKLGTASVFANGKILIVGGKSPRALYLIFQDLQDSLRRSSGEEADEPFSDTLAQIDSSPDRLEMKSVWEMESKKRKPETPFEIFQAAKRQKLKSQRIEDEELGITKRYYVAPKTEASPLASVAAFKQTKGAPQKPQVMFRAKPKPALYQSPLLAVAAAKRASAKLVKR